MVGKTAVSCAQRPRALLQISSMAEALHAAKTFMDTPRPFGVMAEGSWTGHWRSPAGHWLPSRLPRRRSGCPRRHPRQGLRLR